jgi:trigger factor
MKGRITMNVTVEEVGALTRKLTIVLPAEEVAGELEEGYRKLASQVKLKGFRKGKVPRHILEKSYGDQVRGEVGEKLVQATYFDAVEQEKVDPVVHPNILSHDFGDDGTFTYVAQVEVRPEFELGQYAGLEIEKPDTVVTDSEIEEELEQLRKNKAPLRSVDDRAVQMGDLAIVDFQGYDNNGDPIPQVKGDDFTVDIGSGRLGIDFEEQLVGLNKGEEASREIDFAADNPNPILAGKKIEFKITVKEIRERVLPDLDDEFAQDVGQEFATLDDLKAHIRKEKQKQKEETLEGDLNDKIMQKLVEMHDFEVPGRLVVYEIDEYIKQMEDNLSRSGLTLESAGMNREELARNYKEVAEKRVRGDFILKKIAEKEDIKVEEGDINQGFERIAKQYNMSVEEVKGYFQKREDMLPFLNELLNEKTLKFLSAEAKFIPVTEAAAEGTAAEAE